jgi:hypothetical protein
MFFSEEKNQKTFIPALAGRWRHDHQTGSCKDIKVFCFFSSEKKILSYPMPGRIDFDARLAREPSPSHRCAAGPSLSHFVGEGFLGGSNSAQAGIIDRSLK